MGSNKEGGMGCCEISYIREYNWVLTVPGKETTVSQSQTGELDLLLNGCVI